MRRAALLAGAVSRRSTTKEIAMSRLHLQMLAAMTVLAAGCASGPKPAPSTPLVQAKAGDAVTPPSVEEQQAAPPTMSSVHVEARIVHACGDLPRAHFAFDSAQIQPDA